MTICNRSFLIESFHSTEIETEGKYYFQLNEFSLVRPYVSHVIRKSVYAICDQQRRRLACASAQSDQHLCCSLPRQYNISSFYTRIFKPLARICGCAGRFESYLVENPKDRFSCDEAQLCESDSYRGDNQSTFPMCC